jgi:uncharacterized damage-inducible protein DinB
MLPMLQDLIRHKGYTDAALLRAIRQNDKSAQDEELRRLLHHILIANRFWLLLARGLPFVLEEESKIPGSLDEMTGKYRDTHAEELDWVSQLCEADLARRLESAFFEGGSFTVAEGLMQVCMHSHGHRSQCASRLRLLGGAPPILDFILWLRNRPAPDWP